MARTDAALVIDECHNFLNLPYGIDDLFAEARSLERSARTGTRRGRADNARDRHATGRSTKDRVAEKAAATGVEFEHRAHPTSFVPRLRLQRDRGQPRPLRPRDFSVVGWCPRERCRSLYSGIFHLVEPAGRGARAVASVPLFRLPGTQGSRPAGVWV
jgi:hypothetical protein